jgi:hypothetical protein
MGCFIQENQGKNSKIILRVERKKQGEISHQLTQTLLLLNVLEIFVNEICKVCRLHAAMDSL